MLHCVHQLDANGAGCVQWGVFLYAWLSGCLSEPKNSKIQNCKTKNNKLKDHTPKNFNFRAP